MTEELAEQLAGLQRAMAASPPGPEELAAWKAEDKAMAEWINKARPGVPLHHAYGVLETLRTIQHYEASKAEPAMTASPVLGSPIRHALVEVGIIAAEDSALQAVKKIRALKTEQQRYEETVVGELNETVTRLARQASRAEAAVERVRTIHHHVECSNVRCKHGGWCIGCDPTGSDDCLVHPWPCPTVLALDPTAKLPDLYAAWVLKRDHDKQVAEAEAALARERQYCELTADSCHVPTRQTARDVLQLLDQPETETTG